MVLLIRLFVIKKIAKHWKKPLRKQKMTTRKNLVAFFVDSLLMFIAVIMDIQRSFKV